MELVSIDITFFDPITIKAAGVTGTLPKKARFPASSVPVRGDLIRFPGLGFQSGELVFFRVAERALLAESDRVQLTLTLVVAHQP